MLTKNDDPSFKVDSGAINSLAGALDDAFDASEGLVTDPPQTEEQEQKEEPKANEEPKIKSPPKKMPGR